ncbi:MAG: hypothetical protein IPJ26_16735 [Bacteroidetes bacterium]|nr:hypothetical protein [Bacteroidota bacterium]
MRIPQYLLLLLFLLGFGLLAYYNVLMDDDLVMLRGVHAHGIVGATIDHYDSWNTRWMSFFFLHTWMSFWTEDSSPLLYHLFTLGSLLFVSDLFLRSLQANKGLNAFTSTSDRILKSGLFTAAIIISSFHIGDTWFWVNTSTMYGWNLIALLGAVSISIKPLQNKFIQDSLITFLGLYVGGAAEPAVVCLFVILIGVLYYKSARTQEYRNHIINFLIGISVSFGIALAGDGHSKREAALPDLSMMDWLIHSGYFSAKIAFIHAPLRIFLVLTLLYPVFSSNSNTTKLSLGKGTLYALMAWLFVVVLHTYFITYVMGDYGPPRAWSFISFVSVLIGAWWLFHYSDKIPSFVVQISTWVSVGIIAFVVYTQAIELPPYSTYVKKVNAKEILFDANAVPKAGLLHRVSFIENNKKKKKKKGLYKY